MCCGGCEVLPCSFACLSARMRNVRSMIHCGCRLEGEVGSLWCEGCISNRLIGQVGVNKGKRFANSMKRIVTIYSQLMKSCFDGHYPVLTFSETWMNGGLQAFV